MTQIEQYTDFWKLLTKCEDYIRYGKECQRQDTPVFTIKESPMTSPVSKGISQQADPPAGSFTEACTSCAFAKSGRKPVPLLGSLDSPLWVLTDSPSLDAEKKGLPFGDNEMEYFSKWMTAIELDFSQLCLQNIPRCRTPGNRPPFPDELNRCGKELHMLASKNPPKVILSLGPHCSAWLSGQKGLKVSEIRGRLHYWNNIPLVVSYSPEQVLNYGELKRPVWEDLKSLRNVLSGA